MKNALFSLCLFLSFKAFSLDVVFINPSVPGTPFWDRVTASANAAAENLGINLTVIYGKNNRIFNYEALEALLSQAKKPDYIIFSPYDGTTERSFNLLNTSKVKFITLERTLHAKEQGLVGLPQELYPYWLGEIFHDNQYVGKLLINTLINVANERNPKVNKPFNIVGFSGSYSGESADRTEGLLAASKVNNQANILQVSNAGWSREKARNIFLRFNKRYGKIDIVWSASDGMALGVMDAIVSENSIESKNKIVIGGIDWTPEAIRMIKNQKIDASVGGHFMQAAWALVKIYDHHRGVDVFKKSANDYSYQLEVITHKNVDQYMIISKAINWSKVDFKRFSLFHNSQLKKYDFSFRRVIEQIK